MTTAFYVIKTYQSVFERRMPTLQFRSPGIAPGNADESAPDCGTSTVSAVTFYRASRRLLARDVGVG